MGDEASKKEQPRSTIGKRRQSAPTESGTAFCMLDLKESEENASFYSKRRVWSKSRWFLNRKAPHSVNGVLLFYKFNDLRYITVER